MGWRNATGYVNIHPWMNFFSTTKISLFFREIKLLAWMGRFKPLKEMPVYSISYSSVALHVIHERVPNQGLLAALAGRKGYIHTNILMLHNNFKNII